MPSNDSHSRAVEDHYDRTAQRWQGIYDSETFHDFLIRDRMTRALRTVDELDTPQPVTATALDAGCGAGQMVAELSSRGYTTSGFDISANMVTATQQLLAGRDLAAEVTQANGEALPYPDASFDLVSALGYIEYFSDPAVAVAELARVARPGATVLVTAPNPFRIAYALDPLNAVRGYFRPEQGYRRRYHSPSALRRVLVAAGLTPVRVEGHGLGPFTLVGRRLTGDARAIRLDRRLSRLLPRTVLTWLGANLIGVTRKR